MSLRELFPAPRCARLAFFLVLAFATSFLASPFAEARNISRKRQALYQARLKASRKRMEARLPHSEIRTLTPAPAAPQEARPAPSLRPMPAERTLLDEVGRLAHEVPQGQVEGWKRELKTGAAKGLRAGWLHLWLGEWELARSEEPLHASWHFRQAQRLVPPLERVYGLAVYDQAISLFYQGRYERASESFEHLLRDKAGLRGVDRRQAAFWLRHARACWGYHVERKKLGITEPERLDPLCAAAGLATCLQALGMPFDKKTVLAACRVTGMGSNAQDLLDASKKLGLSGRLITADERGLKALPKPLVAYVEHDHFIAVTGASAKGVTYFCSDCGCWPGGQREVTWKQWRAMEPTVYFSVARKDSPEDRLLSTAVVARGKAPGVKLAVNGPGKGAAGLSGLGRLQTLVGALRGHVALFVYYAKGLACGNKHGSQHCCSCSQCCRMHGGGPRGAPSRGGIGSFLGGIGSFFSGLGSPFTALGGGGHSLFGAKGASSGDPVNLATGEEEYTPEPDLVVYNPTNPPLAWQRLYNSLRGPDDTYESDDFGVGWSHEYNYLVYDSAFGLHPQVAQGSSLSFNSDGTAAPAAGLTWDIVQNGTTIATNLVPNGWSVSYSPQFTVTAPAAAATTQNYQVRYFLAGTMNASAFFDVLPQNTLPRGAALDFPNSGTLTPDPANGSWDIYRAGHLVASANQPNGWAVTWSPPLSGTTGTLTLTPPVREVTATGYTVRAIGNTMAGTASGSLTFSVVENRFIAKQSAKYLIMPNGSRITITPSGIPSAAQTSVACDVTPGAPFQVTWFYQSDNPLGSYEIVFPDRSKLYTTRVYKAISGGAGCFCVERIIPRQGNGIYFNYTTGIANSGFPMLSSIVDYQNRATVLLTLNRATDGSGNITSIDDAYGRTVYYRVRNYSMTGVPLSLPQTYAEVDEVRQVAATGTPLASTSLRWTYVYGNVNNGEGAETVPFLTEIHVPSPAGGTESVAKIEYEPNTCYVRKLTDGNKNTTEFTPVMASPTEPFPSRTKVTIKNSGGTVVYSYTAGFDASMNETTLTDGTNDLVHPVENRIYADPNNPYRPSSITDGNGKTTSLTWDQYGNMQTATSPRGTMTVYTWSYTPFALGRLEAVQQGSKTASTFQYFEPSGLLRTAHTPAPGGGGTVTTSLTYDSVGNVLTLTAPGNGTAATLVTTFNTTTDGTYTQAAAAGQPLTVTDNLGKVSHFRYDARGNRTVAVDALGNETDTTYNLADQPVQVTFPATGQTGPGHAIQVYSYLYPGGPLTATTLYDESGNAVRQVTVTYGPEGEVLARGGSTEPASNTYDAAYRTQSLKDGKNNQTTYTYNVAGYLARVDYPGATVGGIDSIQFPAYDAVGNALQRVDGRNQTTNYVYNDPGNALTDVQYPLPAAGLNVHLTYDSYGRRATMTDGTGIHAYAYDDRDGLTSETTTYTGLAAKTVSYTYNPDGSRQSMGTPAGAFTYTYDGVGRMTGLTNPYSESSSWTYLDNSWLKTQTLANNAVTTYTYNALGERTDLENRLGPGSTAPLLSGFNGMVHDAAGNRTSVAASLPGFASYGGLTSYQYDSKDQLTQETSARNGGYTGTFAYDAAGNPTTFKGLPHLFNSDNQDQANVYDGNGNPSTYQGVPLTFDPENRLTSVGAAVLTAGYTGGGLRAWKQSGITRTYFLYDGQTPVLEMDSTGAVTAVNTLGANGLLSRRSGGTSTFYTFDPQGGVAQRLSSTGAVLTAHMFDAYGVGVASGSTTDPYGYGAQWGYYTDRETGLLLLTHRYYDPGTGRFLTRDPIGYAGGINLYAYVQNKPSVRIDPDGDAPITMGTTDPHSLTEGQQWAIIGAGLAGGFVGGIIMVSLGPLAILAGAVALGAVAGIIAADLVGVNGCTGAKYGAMAGAMSGLIIIANYWGGPSKPDDGVDDDAKPWDPNEAERSIWD
jgi:RHS repeat-associated protein